MKNLFSDEVRLYTPCRISECYFEAENEIEISSASGSIRIKGIGKSIWKMLDGKHTVKSIARHLCNELSLIDEIQMQNEVIAILTMLEKKKAIVMNWDPLY